MFSMVGMNFAAFPHDERNSNRRCRQFISSEHWHRLPPPDPLPCKVPLPQLAGIVSEASVPSACGGLAQLTSTWERSHHERRQDGGGIVFLGRLKMNVLNTLLIGQSKPGIDEPVVNGVSRPDVARANCPAT